MGTVSGAAGWVVLAVVMSSNVLTGCAETVTTTRSFPAPDCHVPRSAYERVATAPSLAALERKLLRMPKAQTLSRVGADAEHHAISVSLLSRDSVVLMALELRRARDGGWIAEAATEGCQ